MAPPKKHKLKIVEPAEVQRKDGPSPWGSSYYGLLGECERKFFYRYVAGLVPKHDTDTSVEDLRARLAEAIGGGEGADKVPAAWTAKDADDAAEAFAVRKLDPLRVGTIFHLLLEQWFKGAPSPAVTADECPARTTPEEVAEAVRLSSAYFAKHGTIVEGKSLGYGQNGLDPKAWYEVAPNGRINFKIVSVEQTVAVTDPNMLHDIGLLLPISVRYDTIIQPEGAQYVESLEHKTTAARLDPMAKAMDLQFGMHMLVWNLMQEEGDEPGGTLPMRGIQLDQAVKRVKNPVLIAPDREYFTRSPHQLKEVHADLRRMQAKLIHLWAASEATGDMTGPEAEQLWERRRSACFYWNKPCPYLAVCSEGREETLHLYQTAEPNENLGSVLPAPKKGKKP